MHLRVPPPATLSLPSTSTFHCFALITTHIIFSLLFIGIQTEFSLRYLPSSIVFCKVGFHSKGIRVGIQGNMAKAT